MAMGDSIECVEHFKAFDERKRTCVLLELRAREPHLGLVVPHHGDRPDPEVLQFSIGPLEFLDYLICVFFRRRQINMVEEDRCVVVRGANVLDGVLGAVPAPFLK